MWVRLERGSQWHRAGAECGLRSGAVTEFSGVCPPRAGGYVICLDCAFVSGIAEQAAAYVPEQLAERTTEIPAVPSEEFADSGAVVVGPWASVTPGRHRADGPTREIPRVPAHIRTSPSWSRTNVGVEAPDSWYLPGTSAPAVEGIASAA
ncbi:hypothetical protein GCM10027271_30730 [Saccharopolyspora gloriosae]